MGWADKYQHGGKIKPSYNEWLKKYDLQETEDYNLKGAYESGAIPDSTGHLPSINSKTLEFLKKSSHPTIQKELDWYNSEEGKEFKNSHDIDSTSNKDWWKYVPKKMKQGGVIEDDRGQWAHPGKVTKINSNNITMKGVKQPLIGISDTGDIKLMQPNKDYKFKGESVTEYPLQKSNKSSNFTSQNWLDKY